MLSLLKNHPFGVQAFFETSFVVTYAFPHEDLRPLVPDILELDTFEDRHAFLAVAMVNTKGLRPRHFPRLFGAHFFLIGYRIFVRFTLSNGKRIRGLYILGSRTDSSRMELLGNIFTHYKYSTIDVESRFEDGIKTVTSDRDDLRVSYRADDETVSLPSASPFRNWKEARRFAGPLPFTFTQTDAKDKLLVIEGVRQNWDPKPVEVVEHHFGFIDKLGIGRGDLANAFVIENVPYSWKRGRFEPIPAK